jgi:hypothetical protein
MTHLTMNERLALVEAEGEPEHPHLGECGRCRTEVATARATLADLDRVVVPEPSPLFWDSLSRRVSAQIGQASPVRDRGWWPFWRVLTPLAAGVGALVFAVGVQLGPVPRPAPLPTAEATESGTAPADADAGEQEWSVLVHLASDFDVETLSDSLGRSGEGRSDEAVWQLTERERTELAALLKAELQQTP